MKIYKRMKKNIIQILTLTILGIFLYSCQDEHHHEEETLANENFHEDMIKLGKQLENPYSVSNMQKALNNLKKSNLQAKTSETEIAVIATHLYVKFKPKNEDELGVLKRDSTLVLYPYPLDFEIDEEGDFYRDPEVPEGQPTYQYCAIEVGKQLPDGVEHEILEELFIPDEEKDAEDLHAKNYGSNEIITNLVNESLRITGNLEEEDKEEKGKSSLHYRRSKWRPAGRITVTDDNLGRIGIAGLKVRARRWFTTHVGFTNGSGYFSCDGRFRGKARYKLDWERYHFALRKGGFSSAQKTGPKGRKKYWDWHITDGEHKYYATIFRAAYHYYYQNIQGLRRPPLNSAWRTQLRIGAFTQTKDDKLGTHSNVWRAFGISTPIKIYAYARESQQIYATTIHELVHASHWNIDRSVFNDTDTKVKESWARGVQWVLTRMKYPNYLGRERSTGDYTLVVSDMIDNDFITTAPRTNRGFYRDFNDQVSGYTIKQIEDALVGQKSWNDWRDKIISKHYNTTEENLTRLFEAYEE